jgi:hypothetical protein
LLANRLSTDSAVREAEERPDGARAQLRVSGGYDVEVTRDERSGHGGRRLIFRYQLQGPKALKIIDKAHGGLIDHVKQEGRPTLSTPITVKVRSPGFRCRAYSMMQ